MRKFNPRGARFWMIRHPWLARLYLLVLLPFMPIIYSVAIIWQNRRDFREIRIAVSAIFLPWEKH